MSIVKYCLGTGLIDYLQRLFNKIMLTQEIPDEWMILNIILIHKKGDNHPY